MSGERKKVITEILEIYRNMPCLWNFRSEEYKNKTKRDEAWEILTKKFKQIEPDSDVAYAKKKIEHMRTSYKREAKKVKDSKLSESKKVHFPNLWYYDLLTFLDEQCRNEENLENNVESQEIPNKRKRNKTKLTMKQIMERKKQKMMETQAQERRNKLPSTFALYVGEQLESIETFQRQVAEKLISEVLFLAKTGHLNFDSRVETSKSMSSSSSSSSQRSASPLSNVGSPQRFIIPSPIPLNPASTKTNHLKSPEPSSPSKCVTVQPPSPQVKQCVSPPPQMNQVSYTIQVKSEATSPSRTDDEPSPSVLKDLLIEK
ncbi:uncharacterized protein LOC142981717 [Anticarsia gemmatalis]|uniref:uncharacterized protein LOC142981717 n=1 Tax=Anticarsia gemmatalis TaxID=129554 RepID=UPI003F7693A6